MIDGTGKRIFIIGSGVSLKGFDFSRLDNEMTLAINHAVRYYKKAKMLFFLDKKFVRECEKEIDAFPGIVWACARADYQGDQYHRDKLFRFAVNRDYPQTKLENGLYNGELSGLAAINLALILNFEKIYLLGYRLNGGYFFEDEFKHGEKDIYDERKQRRTLKYFNWYGKKLGRIYNCDVDSDIEVFPKVEIDEVLKNG